MNEDAWLNAEGREHQRRGHIVKIIDHAAPWEDWVRCSTCQCWLGLVEPPPFWTGEGWPRRVGFVVGIVLLALFTAWTVWRG